METEWDFEAEPKGCPEKTERREFLDIPWILRRDRWKRKVKRTRLKNEIISLIALFLTFFACTQHNKYISIFFRAIVKFKYFDIDSQLPVAE